MAEQLTGVLREVLSAADGQPRPAFSGLFSPELRAIGTDLSPAVANGNGALTVLPPPPAEVIAGLPAPLADGTDPAAGYLATLAGLEARAAGAGAARRGHRRRGRPAGVAASPETRLALVRALIATGDLTRRRPHSPTWPSPAGRLAGRLVHRALRAGRRPAATRRGRRSAPSTTSCPASSRRSWRSASPPRRQATWPRRATTSSSCGPSTGPTSAPAFGTARAYLASGDRVGAIAAVAAVPETSSHHAAAQIAAVRLLVAGGAGLSVADLHQADHRLGRLSLDDNDPRRHQLAVEILRAALDWVSDGAAHVPGTAQRGTGRGERILGCEPNERALRFGLERGYRALATLVPERRIELVDMANSVRPRTWV